MAPGHCRECGRPLAPDLGELDIAAAVEAATAGPLLVPGQLPPLDATPDAD